MNHFTVGAAYEYIEIHFRFAHCDGEDGRAHQMYVPSEANDTLPLTIEIALSISEWHR